MRSSWSTRRWQLLRFCDFRFWKDRLGSNVYYLSLCVCTTKPSITAEWVWSQYLCFSDNMIFKINTICEEEWSRDAIKTKIDITEVAEWREEVGPVIVSGKMVWQQLIRLAKLWLSNKHPPLWQPSHHAVNHEHTLTRFSIVSLRRNQIKEQIIRMEPKHKTG